VILETCRFAILCIDLYLPYAFVFFMLFGGPEKLFEKTKKNIDKKTHHFKEFGDMVRFILNIRILTRTSQKKKVML